MRISDLELNNYSYSKTGLDLHTYYNSVFVSKIGYDKFVSFALVFLIQNNLNLKTNNNTKIFFIST